MPAAVIGPWRQTTLCKYGTIKALRYGIPLWSDRLAQAKTMVCVINSYNNTVPQMCNRIYCR